MWPEAMVVEKAMAADPTPAARPAEPAKPVEPHAQPGPGNSALENQGIAMMQRLGDLFAANAQDCDKLASEIKAFVVQNRPLLGQLLAEEKGLTAEQKAAFDARNRAVQEETMKKMAACQDSASVEAAMKDFPTE
jgi:hypothetical protein